MKHKDKLHLARTMMSKVEIKAGFSPFLSQNWRERREAKAQKVKNQQIQAQWKSQKYEQTNV